MPSAVARPRFGKYRASASSGHDGLVAFNSVLTAHLLGVDAGHCQAAVSQQALHVEDIQAVADRLGCEGSAEGVGVAPNTGLSL